MSEEVTLTLDDIVLKGVTRVNENAGWNAPEQRSEAGFEYDSYVRTEPVEGSFESWVDQETYNALDNLRNRGEPFPASIGLINLSLAKLVDLETEQENSAISHYRVTMQIREITEVQIESADLFISTPSGDLGSSSEAADVTTAYSEDADGDTDDETDDSGIVGALSSVRESLSGVF